MAMHVKSSGLGVFRMNKKKEHETLTAHTRAMLILCGHINDFLFIDAYACFSRIFELQLNGTGR